MHNIKDLIIYIEEEMKNVKIMISDLKKQQVDEELEKIIFKIREAITDYKKILNITEEELAALESFCGEHTITNIQGYKQFILKGKISFPDSSKQKLLSFCNIILKKYEESKSIKSNDNVSINELKERFKELKSLRYKVNDSFEFKSSDIDLIIEILTKNGISQEEIIDYVIYISSKFMYKLQQQNLDSEDFVQEKITLEDIIDLFNMYSYDFNVFSKKQQEKILTKGNLNNIKEILEVLKNENINLNDPLNSKTILSGKSNQLCEIFVYSTPELVSKIIDTAKSKIKLYDGEKLNFILLIERPGIFIIKRRNYKHENKGPIDFESNSVCGCHEDFLNNIDLIYDKYKEVYGTDRGFDELFRKSKYTCVFEAPHKKIKNIVSTLEIYGFAAKDYLRALSSFKSTTHADALDVAIELGCYEYVKDNPSKLTRDINSETYTQLAIARIICHLTDDQIFNSKKRSESNTSYIDLKESELNHIIKSNELVFEKFKIEDNYDKEHLSLFEDVEAKIQSSETTNFDLAIKDLEQEGSILSKLEDYTYINDPKVYEINGIRISKNKVLRLYHILKLNNYLITPDFMIYIMSRNSYLTQEQFERLSHGIVEIIGQGEKIV